MRKQTKLVAVLSATALLAVGAAMTSFAATCWQDEEGAWLYYDNYGDLATSEWKKFGDDWYYLVEDGWYDKNKEASPFNASTINAMWVYSNGDGHLITNNWAKLTNGYKTVKLEDVRDDSDAYLFFDSKGAPYRYKGTEEKWLCSTDSIIKKVNGIYYFFDENSFMAYGLTKLADGKYYYFDGAEDGSMRTDKVTSIVENDDEKYTYYFITSGSNKGQGLSGFKDGSVYYHGKLVTAAEEAE